MRPAYELPLNQKQFAQLGELTAIIGQIDDFMVQTVAHLLKVDRAAANLIMGSSKVADNSSIWATTIRNRTKDEDILWLLELAEKDFPDLSRDRNDFIHAVFTHRIQSVGGAAVIGLNEGQSTVINTATGPMIATGISPTALRVRDVKEREMNDLTAIIERAGRLSCLIAHLDHLLAGNPATTSPWLGRLGPSLPPRSGTAATRKAIARRGRRGPSHQ
ncbi:MAG: hypothetical protein WBE84_03265 [Xanthobacteraceae bacterium]